MKEKVHNKRGLTLREKQILSLSARGLTRLDIGQNIHLSPHTVDFHIRSSMRKLKANNITSAVAMAFRQGLIDV